MFLAIRKPAESVTSDIKTSEISSEDQRWLIRRGYPRRRKLRFLMRKIRFTAKQPIGYISSSFIQWRLIQAFLVSFIIDVSLKGELTVHLLGGIRAWRRVGWFGGEHRVLLEVRETLRLQLHWTVFFSRIFDLHFLEAVLNAVHQRKALFGGFEREIQDCFSAFLFDFAPPFRFLMLTPLLSFRGSVEKRFG